MCFQKEELVNSGDANVELLGGKEEERKLKMLINDEWKAIYQMLLQKSADGKEAYRSQKIVAPPF